MKLQRVLLLLSLMIIPLAASEGSSSSQQQSSHIGVFEEVAARYKNDSFKGYCNGRCLYVDGDYINADDQERKLEYQQSRQDSDRDFNNIQATLTALMYVQESRNDLDRFSQRLEISMQLAAVCCKHKKIQRELFKRERNFRAKTKKPYDPWERENLLEPAFIGWMGWEHEPVCDHYPDEIERIQRQVKDASLFTMPKWVLPYCTQIKKSNAAVDDVLYSPEEARQKMLEKLALIKHEHEEQVAQKAAAKAEKDLCSRLAKRARI